MIVIEKKRNEQQQQQKERERKRRNFISKEVELYNYVAFEVKDAKERRSRTERRIGAVVQATAVVEAVLGLFRLVVVVVLAAALLGLVLIDGDVLNVLVLLLLLVLLAVRRVACVDETGDDGRQLTITGGSRLLAAWQLRACC
jgi:hypothetical protein